MLRSLFLAAGVLAVPVCAEALCLYVETGGRQLAAIPAALGDEVRLIFRHSLYGSRVEESFRVGGDGLHLARLRYAEPRLLEFYGHEAARRDGDWWVVEGDWRPLPGLELRVSPESGMQLLVGGEQVPSLDLVEPGGILRISLGPCEAGMRPEETDRHARGDD